MIADLHESGPCFAPDQANTVPPTEVTPLTDQERVRLAQLERVVDEGIVTFRQVGAALLEIRQSRLYREHHVSFGSYLRERYALALSTATQVIASTQTAELLERVCKSCFMDNGPTGG